MTLSSLVCRTCLGIICESKTGYSIEDENGLVQNVQNIREMIEFCFPELNICVSVKPSICEPCLTLLINTYNFKIKCMKVENVILNYIRTNNVMEGSCVNLNNVVRVQIMEALKQKNWPTDLVKEYIEKVDVCLAKSRTPLPNYLNNLNNNKSPVISTNMPEICIDITDSDDETDGPSAVPRITCKPPSVMKENYLSTLNLINSNTLRKEVSLVQSIQEKYDSSQRTRNFVKSFESKKRQIQKPSVKCSNEENNVISDDDSEVLIMNFVESEDLLSNAGNYLKEAYMGDAINPESNTMKRKLTPEETIEEILSKRRKLIVKINPNLPYLHKNTFLRVVLDKAPCYNCIFCKYSCLSREDLKLHNDRLHKTCKLCNFKCGTKPILDKHLNDEHREEVTSILELYKNDKANFLCYCCKYVGLSKDDLRHHRYTSHMKFNHRGIYQCPIPDCDIENAESYLIINHMESRHDSAKRRECPLCNHITFTKPYDAKVHVLSHSLFRETCSFCGLLFRTTSQLKNHMERKHAVPIWEHQSGMVYDFTGDHFNLTTNEDGLVMLGQTSTYGDSAISDTYGTYQQDNDCGMIDENDQDCMIVENDSEPIVVDHDVSFHDWILQGLATDKPTEEPEVITIDDDDDDDIIVFRSDVETSDNGVNDKGGTESTALEESITVEKAVEEGSRLEEQRATFSQVSEEASKETPPNIEKTISGNDQSEANKIKSPLEVQERDKQNSNKQEDDNEKQNSETAMESVEATSSQESSQLQDLEEQTQEETAELSEETPPNIEKTISGNDDQSEANKIKSPLEVQERDSNKHKDDNEKQNSETAMESVEATSSQESSQLQDLKEQTQEETSELSEETPPNIEKIISDNDDQSEANKIKSPLEVQERDSNKHEDDNKKQNSETAMESVEATSSQEFSQLQDLEEQTQEETSKLGEETSSNKDENQPEQSGEMQSESAADSREVTSSQEVQLQDLEESLSVNAENQENIEKQDPSKDENHLQKPENAVESREVTSSQSPQLQDPEESMCVNTKNQQNEEEDSNKAEDEIQKSQNAAESREVTSSQLQVPEDLLSVNTEDQLNMEETLEWLDEQDSRKNLESKEVSSSLECPQISQEITNFTVENEQDREETSKILEELASSKNNDDNITLQQIEELQAAAESSIVTSSQKLSELEESNKSAEELSLEAELVKILSDVSEKINEECGDSDSFEIIQPREASTPSGGHNEFLSDMETVVNAFNMEETAMEIGSENDLTSISFDLGDTTFEVSSSNLLDGISQSTEEIGQFPQSESEVTSSAHLS